MKSFGIEKLEVEELGEVKLLKIGRYGIQIN